MELTLICTWCLRQCYINGCTKSSGMSPLLHISFISVNLSITKLFSTDSISITIPTYTAALFLFILFIADLDRRVKYFKSFHFFFCVIVFFFFFFCSGLVLCSHFYHSIFILSISLFDFMHSLIYLPCCFFYSLILG